MNKINGRIKSLYAEHYSYGMIGQLIEKEFNIKFSRSSVAGVIFRARQKGLMRQNKLPSVRKPPKPFEKGHQYHKPGTRPMTYNKTTKPIAKPAGKPKLFLELNPGECKYNLDPINSAPKWFCGAECLDGEPWCVTHRKICYTRSHNTNPKEGRFGLKNLEG